MRVHSGIDRASKSSKRGRLIAFLSVVTSLQLVAAAQAQKAKDPGPRGAPAGAGGFISGLNSYQQDMELPAGNFIAEVNNVAGGTSVKKVGLGARFDSNACSSCHAGVSGATRVISGGASPSSNPLSGVYQLEGAINTMPYFETANGPTVVARFPYESDLVTPDGHVHQLFVITGRSDAGTCGVQQPDFAAQPPDNIIFRQTTPFFGGGLIEIIQDSDIVANMSSNLSQKQALGIAGHPNYNADDGSITRFGWKAQKRSLLLFAGEAYNIEEGISNEVFPNKPADTETPGDPKGAPCTPPFPLGPPNGNGTQGVPDDRTAYIPPGNPGYLYPGDPERFAIFGRILDQPKPGACPGGNQSSCANGQAEFTNVGCVLCHTTSFTTPQSSIAALSNIQANLFSDLLVHHMGPCDADNVTQGQAGGDEFRTAPLWGVGQRFFFMHDGGLNRHDAPNRNIVQAVEDHYCLGNSQYGSSEANGVITNFNNLGQSRQQDLINFLRSL